MEMGLALEPTNESCRERSMAPVVMTVSKSSRGTLSQWLGSVLEEALAWKEKGTESISEQSGNKRRSRDSERSETGLEVLVAGSGRGSLVKSEEEERAEKEAEAEAGESGVGGEVQVESSEEGMEGDEEDAGVGGEEAPALAGAENCEEEPLWAVLAVLEVALDDVEQALVRRSWVPAEQSRFRLGTAAAPRRKPK